MAYKHHIQSTQMKEHQINPEFNIGYYYNLQRALYLLPFTVKVVSMPPRIWSFTWQWSSHSPGLSAIILTAAVTPALEGGENFDRNRNK